MTQKTYSYVGKGKISLKVRAALAGLKRVGNCSSLSFAVETSSISQPEYQYAGGGEANSIDRISTVGMAMTLEELRPDNLLIALRAAIRAIAVATVTDERHTAYVDSLIPFVDLPDLTESIVVKIDPDGADTLAVVDVDYELTGAGITVIDGGGISDSDVIGVDYTKLKSDVVEAMTNSGEEYTLVFDGLNEAESGAAVVVTVHRVKFSPTSGLELISDEYGNLPLEGSVLSDSTIVGAAISKYFKVQMAEPA